MNKTATIPDRPTGEDRRTYVRLTADQIKLFAERINSDRSLNITQLCADLGISRSTFYFITRGEYRTTPEKIAGIARRIGIDPHEIFPV